MDKNYTVVETSKIAAVYGGGHLHSLVSDMDVENGHIGYVGDLAEDIEGLETHEFVEPAADVINKRRVVLVANPEWNYDETRRTNQALYNYINEAGRVFRAYDLNAYDVYAVSKEGINCGSADAPEVGKFVIVEAGSTAVKMVEESDTSGQGFVGKIIGSAKRGLGWKTEGGKQYGRPYIVYFIEVIRNDILG